MSHRLQTGLLVVRPFGGLALMVRNSLGANIRVLGTDSNCRCLSVMITLHSGFKLLVNVVYLPTADGSAEYKNELMDCLGFLDCKISPNSYDGLVVLGDFNFGCNTTSNGFCLSKDFLDEYKLR